MFTLLASLLSVVLEMAARLTTSLLTSNLRFIDVSLLLGYYSNTHCEHISYSSLSETIILLAKRKPPPPPVPSIVAHISTR
jgi:hypothetical protein